MAAEVQLKSLSLSLSSCCSHLEHRASMKRFVSVQFLNPKTVGRSPWTGISPSQGRYLHKQNKRIYACLEWDSSPRSQCLSERRRFMP
jgi:hypothetical protein